MFRIGMTIFIVPRYASLLLALANRTSHASRLRYFAFSVLTRISHPLD